jgi:predicted transcriptional regulator
MEPSATTAAADALLKTGIMGAVFLFVTIPLGVFCWKLYQSQKKAHELRADEAKQMLEKRTKDMDQLTDRLLAVNDKWSLSVTQQITAINSLNQTMSDVKDTMKDVRDLLMERSQR